MNKNKYVAFDLGNVIVRFSIENFIIDLENLALRTGSAGRLFDDSDNFKVIIDQLQKLQDCGLTTVPEYFSDKYNLNSNTIEIITEMWNQYVCPNKKMIKLLYDLRYTYKNVNIAFLSNLGRTHGEYLKNLYGEVLEDSVQWLSYEVGARKPTKLFFQSFLIDHPEFKNCLYFDDLEDNLKTGREYGFNTFKFELSAFEKLTFKEQDIQIEKITQLILGSQ